MKFKGLSRQREGKVPHLKILRNFKVEKNHCHRYAIYIAQKGRQAGLEWMKQGLMNLKGRGVQQG